MGLIIGILASGRRLKIQASGTFAYGIAMTSPQASAIGGQGAAAAGDLGPAVGASAPVAAGTGAAAESIAFASFVTMSAPQGFVTHGASTSGLLGTLTVTTPLGTAVGSITAQLGPAYPASYSNQWATGDRIGMVRANFSVTAGGGAVTQGTGGPKVIIDGSTTNSTMWLPQGQTTGMWTFQFIEPLIITEMTYYQDISAGQGTWQAQGSNDGSTWTNIGATFTLGVPATQVITTLSANTTAYKYYQLQQVGGATTALPYVQEIEFKTGWAASTFSYHHPQGSGNRATDSAITVTTNGSPGSNVTPTDGVNKVRNLINGFADDNGNDSFYFTAGQSNVYIDFQFAVPRFVDKILYIQDDTSGAVQGTWRIRASNDGSTWADLLTGISLGAVPYQELVINATTTPYLIYRMEQTSGFTSVVPWMKEVCFSIDHP